MQRGSAFFQQQVDALEPSAVKKFFAQATPCCFTPHRSHHEHQPGLAGLPAGLAAGAVLAGLTFGVGVTAATYTFPAWLLTAITVGYIITELQENIRDVELAELEIEYLKTIIDPLRTLQINFYDYEMQAISELIRHETICFFNDKVDLTVFSKKNILDLILKHPDPDTKIALLENCLGDPALGRNQKTALARRFWNPEGFPIPFECNINRGNLARIQAQLTILRHEKTGVAKYQYQGLILNRAR